MLTPFDWVYTLTSPLRGRVDPASAGDNCWYRSEEIPDVRADDSVTITMIRCNSLEVDLGILQHSAPHDYEAWLETSDGLAVRVEKTVKHRAEVVFVNVPSGKVRAVVQTRDGTRVRSPVVDVKIAQSYHIAIEGN